MPDTKLVIGIDEVGYGPSLGPLVVAATAWRMPGTFAVESMSNSLSPEFLPKPVAANSHSHSTGHIPIGDSKEVYRAQSDLNSLAQGVNFLMRSIESPHKRFSQLLKSLAVLDARRVESLPWYADNKSDAAERIDRDEFLLADHTFHSGSNALAKHQLQLLGIETRVIDEREFNRQIDIVGNKSNILTEVSLGLAKSCSEKHAKADESIEVYCDRHGGRKKYQAVLMHAFESWGAWFNTLSETQSLSCYTTQYRGSNFRIQFQVGGDALFPSSAASIVAKFLREMMMHRWNRFWIDRGAAKELTIRPTAGYYVDAVRFAADIEPLLSEVEITRDQWWRKK